MKKVLMISAIASLFIGCGGGSSGTSFDMVDYLPSQDTVKRFFTTDDRGNTNFYEEDIDVNLNTINIKIDDNITKTFTINEDTIVEEDIDSNITKVLSKSIKEGDTLYSLPKTTDVEDITFDNTVLGTRSTELTITCKLDKQLDKIEDYEIKYYGDILKFKCIEDKKIVTHVVDNLPDYINLTDGEEVSDYDISYFYMKKGVGTILKINDDCIVSDSNGDERINDASTVCQDEHYSHTFFLE